MKVVTLLAAVDETKCNGDKRCQRICPAGAIRVEAGLASVDPERCVACGKCVDVCTEEAVRLNVRPEPRILAVDVAAADPARVEEICRKAHCRPALQICACTGTEAREVAAAILGGAKSPEDLVLMTGIGSGCGIYCMGVVFRLLDAAGVRVPEDPRWHPLSLSLWDVPDELARKYPDYYLDEDRKVLSG
ncbi:MAG: 4Fe-4S binding protein [Proteobacteria bacterium]|nr:4Fe-4S binding protein [Pseudomonadota bacterium]